MKSTPLELSSSINYLKSLCSFTERLPLGGDDVQQDIHSLSRRQPGIVGLIGLVSVLEAAEDLKYLFRPRLASGGGWRSHALRLCQRGTGLPPLRQCGTGSYVMRGPVVDHHRVAPRESREAYSLSESSSQLGGSETVQRVSAPGGARKPTPMRLYAFMIAIAVKRSVSSLSENTRLATS